jgi:hypothetical protein
MGASLKKVWKVATGGAHGLKQRKLEKKALKVPAEVKGLKPSGNPLMEAARKAIMDTVQASCGVTVSDALEIQAKHSAGFMLTKECHRGVIGSAAKKTLDV